MVALPVLPAELSAPLVLGTAFTGGIAPDLDIVGDHRRTLHFPVVESVLATFAVVVAVLTVAPAVVLAAVFLTSAAVHALSGVLGGSAETEPWNPSTERGVYDHVAGRWWRPRRFVRYSGAPEDFLLGVPFALAATLSPVTGPGTDTAIFAVVVTSGVYALMRRRIGRLLGWLSRAPPAPLNEVAPVVVEDGDGETLLPSEN